MHVLRQLVLDFKSRRKAHLAVSFLVAANQLTVVALAAAPPSTFVAGAIQSMGQNAICGAGVDATTSASHGCTSAPTADETHVSVPAGGQQCPASGPGAACSSAEPATKAEPGVASTPDGLAPCGDNPSLSSPAACTDTVLASSPSSAATRGESVGAPADTPSNTIAAHQSRRNDRILPPPPAVDGSPGTERMSSPSAAICTPRGI